MLKSIPRPSTWQQHGYVCHACRVRLQSERRGRRGQQLAQARQQSTVATEADQDAQDAWADSFNDMSETYSDPKPRHPKFPGPSKLVAKGDNREETNVYRKFRDAKASTKTLVSRKEKPRHRTFPGPDDLKARLEAHVPRDASGEPSPLPSANSTRRLRIAAARLREKEGKPTKGATKGAPAGRPPAEARLLDAGATDHSLSSAGRTQLDEIIRGLKENVKVQATQQGDTSHSKPHEEAETRDGEAGHSNESNAEPLRRSLPNFDVVSVDRTSRTHSGARFRKHDKHDADDASGVVRIRYSTAPTEVPSNDPPPILQTSNPVPNAPQRPTGLRLVDLLYEQARRTPWGDLARATPLLPSNNASFRSLRRADTISPIVPIATATNHVPFGMAPILGAGDREKLPGAQPEQRSIESGESPPSLDLFVKSVHQGPDSAKHFEDYSMFKRWTAAKKDNNTQTERAGELEVNPELHETLPGLMSKPAGLEQSLEPAHVRLAALHQPEDTGPDHESTQALEPQLSIDNVNPDEPVETAKSPKSLTQRKNARTKRARQAKKVRELSASSGNIAEDQAPDQAPDQAVRGKSIAAAMNPAAAEPAPMEPVGVEAAEPVSATPPPDVPFTISPRSVEILAVKPSTLEVMPLDLPQPPVPYLEYGLDRTLFNPGVYQLQDPASRVYNFDPYLQKIMPVAEFDFDSLKQYKTSSQDKALASLALDHGKRYIGSTSSMTATLSHFHYLLSNWRPLNLDMFSRGFLGKTASDKFTKINKVPTSIFLRWKNGSYAIDADKEFDSPNVLMMLGKSMELLLTQPTSEFERYRKSDPRQVSEEAKTAPESYQYTTMGDFLMRSQLDAYDPRLPGNGMFDLKTRAVVSVRMSTQDYEPMTGYEIYNLQGKYGSYEREYYDMLRATMLKYMLQARMGRMNGIFVAYHNVKRIFGFQYIPIHEMDRALHGQTDTCLGDQEFKASLEILNKLLDKATAKFPEQSLRLCFEAQETSTGTDQSLTSLHCFAEPMTDEAIDTIQNSQTEKIAAFERNIMGSSGTSANATPVNSTSPSTGSADTDNATTDIRSMMTYADTATNADAPFLSDIAAAGEAELKPLFYATVILQSQVNGSHLENNRPANLSPTDTWSIEYLMKEFGVARHEWALYEDMRARRRAALWDTGDEEDGMSEESEGRRAKKVNVYGDFLRGLSEKGTALREKVDNLDAGKPVVRVEEGLPAHREEIGRLEDYMGWLYGSK